MLTFSATGGSGAGLQPDSSVSGGAVITTVKYYGMPVKRRCSKHLAGRNLRRYVFTEGHNLQVLSVRLLEGSILHQTVSFPPGLQQQGAKHRQSGRQQVPRDERHGDDQLVTTHESYSVDTPVSVAPTHTEPRLLYCDKLLNSHLITGAI